MVSVSEKALDWALSHVTKFYDSDFFPKSFEFEALRSALPDVQKYVCTLELDDYAPKYPSISMAPKANGTYRVVHRLDPIDTLILTAIVFEIHKEIEAFRIPANANIACSYRIKPDTNGSFFDKDESAWDNYKTKLRTLAEKHPQGYVIDADITDFYNQIYTHRLRNIVSEAGAGKLDEEARVLERFILNLNNKTSRGIPVGPAASIVLAEAIMADIDNKICTYTKDFVRWVDDITIFLPDEHQARWVLHELTTYLYTQHRLVFSGEKSNVNTVEWLMTKHAKDGKSAEEAAILKKKEERTQARLANLIGELDSSPYGDFEDLDDEELAKIIDEDADDDGQSVLPEAYQQLVESALGGKKLDVPTLRHVLRRAGTYRIRTILPTVLQNFEHLLPVIREVVIFVERVLNDESVKRHADHFERILQSNEMKFPFVNMWVSYLFQNQHFNAIGLPANYDHFHELRDKALIARRKRDAVFVKTFKDKLDVLGPWDRRAIIYSADILSKDEMRNWTALVSAKGDILEKSICALLRSRN